VPAPSPPPFQPPATVLELLELCAGRWLSLRTLVSLSRDEEGWDQSQSAQLEFTWQPAKEGPELGVLQLHRTQQPDFQLRMVGIAQDQEGDFQASDGCHGRWRFSGDHVLELTWCSGAQQFCERIWFSKANLRLRSRVITSLGNPAVVEGCGFYSEIRRVQR